MFCFIAGNDQMVLKHITEEKKENKK